MTFYSAAICLKLRLLFSLCGALPWILPNMLSISISLVLLCTSTNWRHSFLHLKSLPNGTPRLTLHDLILTTHLQLPRQLHRFVPLPTEPRPSPSLASHGDLPPHFVLNPEPHFHPTIPRESHPTAHS